MASKKKAKSNKRVSNKRAELDKIAKDKKLIAKNISESLQTLKANKSVLQNLDK